MSVKLEQIKLANAVKVGRHEELLFISKPSFRNHGTEIELVAVKMPVENSPGEFIKQPLVKLTDRQSGETSYTSLMNAIYFKAEFETCAKPEVKRKKTVTF